METGSALDGEKRPAFYALRQGAWRDYLTLLHPPYTLWHLSYVVMGAAAAPVLRLDRLGLAALAFFLAVGLGAHALDELNRAASENAHTFRRAVGHSAGLRSRSDLHRDIRDDSCLAVVLGIRVVRRLHTCCL